MFSYGFYNSLNGDRKYNAEQMSSIFDGVIVDGVFENIGEIFATVPGAGLEVIVKTGRAWFKHTWSLNDSWMPLTLPEADTYRSRIDAVVLEVNHDIDVRKNEIKIISGEPALVAIKPTMVHDENIDQYALAYVTVPAMATSILEDNIEIMVGRGDTPFVTCPLTTIPIDDLFNQWDGEFTTWFNNLKEQLTDNVVTNLQSQITANKEGLESLQTQFSESLPLITDGMGAGSLFSVSKYYKEPITDAVLCNGGYVSGDTYPELLDVLGLKYGGTVTSDLVNAQYGLNSTYEYPQTYNRKYDFFAAFSPKNNRIIIYRKNQAPQVISVPTSVYPNPSTVGQNELGCISFGDIIICYYAVYDSGGSSMAYFIYNVNANTFKQKATAQYIDPSIILSSTYYGVIDFGDFYALNGLATPGYIIRIRGSDGEQERVYTNGITYGGISATTFWPTCCLVASNDPTYIYVLGSAGSNIVDFALYRANKVDFANASADGSVTFTKLSSTVSMSGIQGGGFIFDGYLYADSGNTIYSVKVTSSGLSSVQTALSISGSYGNAPFVGLIPLDDHTLYGYKHTVASNTNLTLTYRKAGFIFSSGSVRQETVTYGPGIITEYVGNDSMPTDAGIRSNYRLGTIKLPTITQSESLVYMRTKTPPKEA